MKRNFDSRFFLHLGSWLLLLALAWPAQAAFAQAASTPAQAVPAQSAAASGSSEAGPKAEGQKAEDETGEFLHSPAVRALARVLHVDVDTASNIFFWFNFLVLAFCIVVPLARVLPKVFRNRREALQKQLVEARGASEQARERLSGVEERLARIDEEIAAIRRQVEEESAHDEQRIKAALEEEKRRIVEAAGQEIDAAGAAAHRELKRFAAELAVDRATGQLSLTPETDRKLIDAFARDLARTSGSGHDGGRN